MTEPALPSKRTRKPAAAKAQPTAKTATAKTKAATKTATAKTKAAAKTPRARAATATPTAKAAPKVDGMPRRSTPAPKSSERDALDLARRIVELAEDKKAADIVLLDLTPLTTLADYFVICSGGSERQLDAIADGIIGPLRDDKIKPMGREGLPASHWVLLDFGSVVVHIFTPPERDYYGLEKHWSEAKTVLRVQ